MSADPAEELLLLVRAGYRLVALETFEEERALRVLGRVAGAAERRLVTWSVASGVDGGGDGAGSLEAGLRALESVTEPALFVLLDAARGLESDTAVRRLREQLAVYGRRRQAAVFVAPVVTLPLELAREAGRAEIPLPREEELASLFRRVLEAGATPPPPGAEALLGAAARAALGLGAGEAQRLYRKAVARADGLSDDAVACLVREKSQALRRTPALTFHDADTGLEDVGGLGELKRWLRERQRAFGEEARRFGLPAPRGLLLLGVQGCGKSLCAKAVAREWRFPLLRIDLASVFGAERQAAESAAREAIAVAESMAPAVLWLDEIEKGFAAAEADARVSRVLGWFLTWLSEKRAPVFVVATANDVTRLPPELLRRGRFDEVFFVDLPSAAERAEILAIHLARRGRDPLQLPLAELAARAERLSGAELEQVVAAGLWAAFAEGRELAAADLENAMQETVPLYDTYEERIKELRDWARHRARPATLDARQVDLFERP